jgi:hypothetical protein
LKWSDLKYVIGHQEGPPEEIVAKLTCLRASCLCGARAAPLDTAQECNLRDRAAVLGRARQWLYRRPIGLPPLNAIAINDARPLEAPTQIRLHRFLQPYEVIKQVDRHAAQSRSSRAPQIKNNRQGVQHRRPNVGVTSTTPSTFAALPPVFTFVQSPLNPAPADAAQLANRAVVNGRTVEIVSAHAVNSINLAADPRVPEATSMTASQNVSGAGLVGDCRRAGWSGNPFILDQLAGDPREFPSSLIGRFLPDRSANSSRMMSSARSSKEHSAAAQAADIIGAGCPNAPARPKNVRNRLQGMLQAVETIQPTLSDFLRCACRTTIAAFAERSSNGQNSWSTFSTNVDPSLY